jgi:hypothetical protein
MKIRSAVQQSLADLYLVRRDEASVAPVDRAILQGLEALLNTRQRLPGDCVFSGFHPGHIGLHGPVDHHPEIGGAASRSPPVHDSPVEGAVWSEPVSENRSIPGDSGA